VWICVDRLAVFYGFRWLVLGRLGYSYKGEEVRGQMICQSYHFTSYILKYQRISPPTKQYPIILSHMKLAGGFCGLFGLAPK
jgi:hypothetical protein